jgi:hypothetical protein
MPSQTLAVAVLDADHVVTGHLDGAVRILRKDGSGMRILTRHGSRINGIDVAPGAVFHLGLPIPV